MVRASGAVNNSRAITAAQKFRVVCMLADGSPSLVKLCPTFTEAKQGVRRAAKDHFAALRSGREAILRDPQRPRAFFMERWVGSDTAGSWLAVERHEDGLSIEFFDRYPYTRRHSIAEMQVELALSAPASRSVATARVRAGDVVECVLLPERTRKNGWFAKVVDAAVSGPITASAEVPGDCRAGQRVRLKVCGIRAEKGFAQFAWVDQAS